MRTMKFLPTSSLLYSSLENGLNSYCSYSTTSHIKAIHKFVPRYEDANDRDIENLSEFVNKSQKLLALTGKLLLLFILDSSPLYVETTNSNGLVLLRSSLALLFFV